MKRIISCLLLISFLFMLNTATFAEKSTNNEADVDLELDNNFAVEANSAYLIDAKTGTVLFRQNEDDKASPASVTKVMTLLIVSEDIAEGRVSLSDSVSISAYASSMGGSQVFLSEGELMSVEDLLKCTIIASANDAAVALAEHTLGSEENFVRQMNQRAKELSMENTNFENVTGLDDTTDNNYSSAKDIAIMSRELIKHEVILKYSSLWQDSIRNGEFTLTNTNRLVRYYDGCNGLKTGSTDKAGYCISVTAQRGGMQLIAVIMGAPTRDARNTAARQLLDYGFSSYCIYENKASSIENVRIYRCSDMYGVLVNTEFSTLVEKGQDKKVELVYELPEYIGAPVKAGDVVGKITYYLKGEKIGESEVYLLNEAESLSYLDIFLSLLGRSIS